MSTYRFTRQEVIRLLRDFHDGDDVPMEYIVSVLLATPGTRSDTDYAISIVPLADAQQQLYAKILALDT